MAAASSVSVVAPTYRRPVRLARLLDGLAAQVPPGVPWTVVIVDNEPDGANEDAVRARAEAFPAPLEYVHEPALGSAHARNRGIAVATGDVVAMIDDDVVPRPDWLRQLVEPILVGRCEGTGGTVLLDPDAPRPRWWDEAGIGGYVAHWEPAVDERPLCDGEFVITANAAWRTDLLRSTGGFDPALGPRGAVHLVGDDALLTRRFRQAGGRMRYVPAAVVVHDLPPERRQALEVLRTAYYHGRSDWILDRDELEARRLNGSRVAWSWLGRELGRRAGEGLFRPSVAFHAVCDIARTSGRLRQALTWAVEGRSGRPAATPEERG